jgi:hypothetical protein
MKEKRKTWQVKKSDQNNLVNVCKAFLKAHCSYFSDNSWSIKPFEYGNYEAVFYDYGSNSARYYVVTINESDLMGDPIKKKLKFEDLTRALDFGYGGFFIFRKDWQEVSDLWEKGEDDREVLPWKW